MIWKTRRVSTDFFKETAKRLLRFEDELERSSYIKTIAGTYQVEPEELRKMVNRLAMKGVGMTENCQTQIGSEQEQGKAERIRSISETDAYLADFLSGDFRGGKPVYRTG